MKYAKLNYNLRQNRLHSCNCSLCHETSQICASATIRPHRVHYTRCGILL